MAATGFSLTPSAAWHWGAVHVWKCFGAYLRAESEEQVEHAVWKVSGNA
ncbi:MAG TPA: hypothetical protein VFA99_17410 [Acidobacteriaceae bacterium]|jgi:hypothetical protein|nr:hypothetical protein [Acidobacteriaceae bacterium]